MTNKKVTRRALLMSVTSLLICISMLLGTTFAWFTDEVTSGVNQIVAGNLDVELYHSTTGVTNATVTGETKLFNTPASGDMILWEPGAMAYETFSVENKGTLSLDYKMQLAQYGYNTVVNATGADTGKSLLDVLQVAVVEGDTAPTRTSIAAITDWTILKNFTAANINLPTSYGTLDDKDSGANTQSFTLILYWPQSDADNDWNLKNGAYASDSPKATTDPNSANVGQLYVDLGVKLVATQHGHNTGDSIAESDSFGPNYDVDAEYPDVSMGLVTISAVPTDDVTVNTTGAVKSAVVAANAAAGVFNSMKSTDDDASNDLTLNLSVNKTGETVEGETTTVDLNIDMTAIMKSVKGSDTTTTTENVTSFDDYITIEYDIGVGRTNVVATHKGEAMVAATDTSSDNGKGIYSYDAATGIITIKTKTLSPFAVSYDQYPTARAEATNDEDVVLELGNIKVTVPASATKIGSTLKMTVEELSEQQAKEDGEFQIGYSTYDNKYYKIKIDGIPEENSTNLKFEVYLGKGLNGQGAYRNKQPFSFPNGYSSNINTGIMTINTPQAGKFTLSYQIRNTITDIINLEADIGNGKIATAVLNGTKDYVTSKVDVEDLQFTISEGTVSSRVAYNSASQIAFAYNVFIKGLTAGHPTIKIPTDSIISDDALNIIAYKDGNAIASGDVTFNPESKILSVKGEFGQSSYYNNEENHNLTIVYTKPNAAEKAILNSPIGEDKRLIINSPVDNEMIDLVNVQNVLSVDGLTATGADENLATTVKSTNAVITANNFSLKDITIDSSSGLTIKGNGTTIEHTNIIGRDRTQNILILNGINSTVKDTTITSYDKSISAGDRGALYFTGENKDNYGTTNVENVTISGENYGVGIAVVHLHGELNIKNTKIHIRNEGIRIKSNQTPPASQTLNITGCEIDSTSNYINRTRNTVFTNTTFKNSWTADRIMFTLSDVGTVSTAKLTFNNCEFKNGIDFTVGYNGGIGIITFNNCTYNGEIITEDNINDYFSFSKSGISEYQVAITNN